MIWFIIVFSFVKSILLNHKGYAHTHTHADINSCVCVWAFQSACGCVCVCVLYSLTQMVRILLCLHKAAIIKSQTLELNHKYWEIPLLTWCLTQSCLTLSATLLGNRRVRRPAMLRTFSTGSVQPPASISQPSEIPHKKLFIIRHALKMAAAYSVWW